MYQKIATPIYYFPCKTQKWVAWDFSPVTAVQDYTVEVQKSVNGKRSDLPRAEKHRDKPQPGKCPWSSLLSTFLLHKNVSRKKDSQNIKTMTHINTTDTKNLKRQQRKDIKTYFNWFNACMSRALVSLSVSFPPNSAQWGSLWEFPSFYITCDAEEVPYLATCCRLMNVSPLIWAPYVTFRLLIFPLGNPLGFSGGEVEGGELKCMNETFVYKNI